MKWSIHKSTVLQILFWGGAWLLLPFIFMSGFDRPNWWFIRILVTFVAIGILIFANLEILLPRFFFKKKYVLYGILALTLILILVMLMQWEDAPWSEYMGRSSGRSRPSNRPRGLARGMRYLGLTMILFVCLIGSSLVEMVRYASQKEKESTLLRSEKLETEMKFLKSQMNPHFLFNALNNIYALSVIKADKAPDHLLKLSDMLRYMLYDCNEEKVPLAKELTYIRNFVDLNLLKDSRGLNVRMDLDEQHPEIMVAPMLFIPLIENAFKHSKIEDLTKGWIAIRLETSTDQLLFEVKNSCPEHGYTKDEIGGIGLKNVRRQLELLYPDKHSLVVEQQEEIFSVQLKIILT